MCQVGISNEDGSSSIRYLVGAVHHSMHLSLVVDMLN